MRKWFHLLPELIVLALILALILGGVIYLGGDALYQLGAR